MKKNQVYKKISVILYLFILFVSVLQAKNKVELQVQDIWTGQPLGGVSIICNGDTLYTNLTGYVSAAYLHDETQAILIEKAGYFPVKLPGLNKEKKKIYLVPIENSEDITVIASQTSDSRLALPAHVSVIRLDSGKESSANNLPNILQSQSGVHIKSYGSSGQLQTISIRGMSASQTQVLFDGVPLNNLQLGSFDFGQYEVQHLSAMEIYRGGNALFGGGGAIGGQVNIQPVLPADRFSYGLNYQKASFGNESYSGSFDLPFNRFRQRITLERSYGSNRYSVFSNGQKIRLQNRDFKNWQITHQAFFALSSFLNISSYLSSYKFNGGSAKAFTGAAAEAANIARSVLDNSFFKIKLKYFKPGESALLQGYIRNEWMGYGDPLLEIKDLYFNQEKGLQLRGRYLVSSNFLLSGGLETSLQEVKGSNLGTHKRMRGAVYLLSDVELLRNRHGLKSLHLNNSLRLEKYDNRQTIPLAAAGISALWADCRAWLSVGKNYRTPTFNDLYWRPGGNPDLIPEKSVNSEAGFEYRKAGKFLGWKALVSGFMNRVRDQIQWLPGASYWQPQNIAAVFSRGLELETRLYHTNEMHSVEFNYTLLWAEKDKASIKNDLTVGNQLPFLPREKWNVSLQSGWRNLRLGAQLMHSSFSYKTIQNDAGDILPSYTTMDIWAKIHFCFARQHFALNFSVQNLQNKQYERIAGYPMPPRNYRLGVDIKY